MQAYDGQALHQALHVLHAEVAGPQRQPGPVHPAGAVGQQRVQGECEVVFGIGFGWRFALVLNALGGVDEGGYFFSVPALRLRYSVTASAMAWLTAAT